MPELSSTQPAALLFALPSDTSPASIGTQRLAPQAESTASTKGESTAAPLEPSDPKPARAALTGSYGPEVQLRPVPVQVGTRQRRSRQQGMALEVLGHAIEYLVDSRLVQFEQETTRGDTDAVRLLIWASREVFAETPVSIPVTGRLRRWLYKRVMSVAA